MSLRSTVAEIGRVVAEHYERLVTVTVQFTELRRATTEELAAFKEALIRLERSVVDMQIQHANSLAEIRASIQTVDSRLSVLSERALHIAVADAARAVAERQLQLPSPDPTSSEEDGGA
jgi:SMC interacting uncharacterized protein involved in chromosome segregation